MKSACVGFLSIIGYQISFPGVKWPGRGVD